MGTPTPLGPMCVLSVCCACARAGVLAQPARRAAGARGYGHPTLQTRPHAWLIDPPVGRGIALRGPSGPSGRVQARRERPALPGPSAVLGNRRAVPCAPGDLDCGRPHAQSSGHPRADKRGRASIEERQSFAQEHGKAPSATRHSQACLSRGGSTVAGRTVPPMCARSVRPMLAAHDRPKSVPQPAIRCAATRAPVPPPFGGLRAGRGIQLAPARPSRPPRGDRKSVV